MDLNKILLYHPLSLLCEYKRDRDGGEDKMAQEPLVVPRPDLWLDKRGVESRESQAWHSMLEV